MTSSVTPEAPSWLPTEARVIVLIDEAAGDWASAAAIEIAEAIAGSRPRTLLVNASAGGGGLDDLLDARDRRGLTAALAGEATVAQVAFKPTGCTFSFIPAGRPALPLTHLWPTPGFGQLMSQVRRGNGTLLLYVGTADVLAAATGRRAETRRVDGCVLLGTEDRRVERELGWRVLVKVETSTPPTAGQPSVEGAAGSSSSSPLAAGPVRPGVGWTPVVPGPGGAGGAGRSAKDRFRARVAGRLRAVRPVLIVWAAAVTVVWFVLQGLGLAPDEFPLFPEVNLARSWRMKTDSPAMEEDVTSLPAAVEPAAGPPAAAREPGAEHGTEPISAEARGPEERAAAAERESTAGSVKTGEVDFRGEERPYSVLVASYANWDDAMRQKRRLERDGGLYFVAPTPIRDRVYYRLLAGALPDRIEGERFMDELVREGRKERRRNWDVRPVRLSFALGTFGSAGAAEELRDLLHEQRLPGYVLTDSSREGSAYRVYSGAFESEAAAAVLGEQLHELGHEAVLVPRRGMTP